jgi:NAD(P)-dependent dehydrogenase (short-subunit alcohol dehydrogenase family)
MGRCHALLLAARGANVVVNDIGNDPETPGYTGTASAHAVAEEIRALGGNAVADTHSVATEAGGNAIVRTAMEAYGSVDILVNNAAISIAAPFDEMTSRDFQRTIDINLMGPIWLCRAAWPHMRAKGHGRIINVASRAFTGFSHLTAYSTSKGGLFSLTRALAAEGAPFGIKANIINPGAFTRMVTAQMREDASDVLQNAREHMPADLVSPVVGFLAADSCPITGECIETAGGMVQRVYIAQTAGFSDTGLTIETLIERWPDVTAGTADAMLGCGFMDSEQWGFRPYRPKQPADA